MQIEAAYVKIRRMTDIGGPLQAQIDGALNPAWGNTATNVSTIRVRAGTTIFEGSAAPQGTIGGSLTGDGNQVHIARVEGRFQVVSASPVR
jgi:hypothetical protein